MFRDGFYLTYPHSNGFADGGRSIVLGRCETHRTTLWKVPLDGVGEEMICEFPRGETTDPALWFDVAARADRLVLSAGNALWLFDLNDAKSRHCLYRADAPATLATLASVTADGRHALVGQHRDDRWSAVHIDLSTGAGTTLFEHSWYVSHLHFSPNDPEWIGYCHEGKTETIEDRVWGWHAQDAPRGRCLFDQRWNDPARRLYVGHEKWCAHDRVAVAVAYGVSPGTPRGIYELSPDRPARLVSQGDRDWHVDVSRSGRWAVVDTTGPHDQPGRGWDNAGNRSDVLLLDMVTGERRLLARTFHDPHPYHPHPIFSPDERFIFHNEAYAGHGGGRVMRIENPLL